MPLPRRRKYLGHDDVRDWKRKSQFSRAMIRNQADSSAVTRAAIDAGRGEWRPEPQWHEAAERGDPMAVQWQALASEWRALVIRAESWFGPAWSSVVRH